MIFRIKFWPAVLALALLSTSAANAGLLKTDGAGTVDPKHVEAELNGSYANDNDKSGGVTTKTDSTAGDVTITAGLLEGMDVSATLPYEFHSNQKVIGASETKTSGLKDMTVGLKYQFLDMDDLKLAIKPGLIIPTGETSEGLSDGKMGITTSLLATKEFAEGKVAIHANVGYERHSYKEADVKDTTRADIFTASTACEVKVADGLKVAAETGLAINPDKSADTDTPLVFALLGASYEVNELLDVYVGVKAGLTKPEDDVTALFGMKLKF